MTLQKHSLEKGNALIWAREVAVNTHQMTMLSTVGLEHVTLGIAVAAVGSFVRRKGEKNSTARAAAYQSASNRVNDLPCMVKSWGQRPVEAGHLCPPPSLEVFPLVAGRMTGLLARIQNATWRRAEVRNANTQQAEACRHCTREATMCMDVRADLWIELHRTHRKTATPKSKPCTITKSVEHSSSSQRIL